MVSWPGPRLGVAQALPWARGRRGFFAFGLGLGSLESEKGSQDILQYTDSGRSRFRVRMVGHPLTCNLLVCLLVSLRPGSGCVNHCLTNSTIGFRIELDWIGPAKTSILPQDPTTHPHRCRVRNFMPPPSPPPCLPGLPSLGNGRNG